MLRHNIPLKTSLHCTIDQPARGVVSPSSATPPDVVAPKEIGEDGAWASDGHTKSLA